MVDSVFDPSVFLDVTTTEALVRRQPLPVGDYQGEIVDISGREWTGKKDPTKSGIAADVKIKVLTSSNPEAASIGYDEVTLQDSIMLEQNENGSLNMAPGHNSALRRYREALGLNRPGEPFSLRMMVGRTVKVKVKHELYQNELYDRIDSVIKA